MAPKTNKGKPVTEAGKPAGGKKSAPKGGKPK